MRRGSLESRLASLDIGLERLEALSEPPRAAAVAMGFRPGLSPDEISSLPHHTARSSSTDSCAICLDSFESGAIMTLLACTHAFHRECIHKWLSASKLCPLCKTHALDGCEDRTSERQLEQIHFCHPNHPQRTSSRSWRRPGTFSTAGRHGSRSAALATIISPLVRPRTRPQSHQGSGCSVHWDSRRRRRAVGTSRRLARLLLSSDCSGR